MIKKNNFLKDLLDLPITMYYMLFKSSLAPMLWGAMIVMYIVFMYVVITG